VYLTGVLEVLVVLQNQSFLRSVQPEIFDSEPEKNDRGQHADKYCLGMFKNHPVEKKLCQ
jgi:hypothetical protein